jgi:F0F1-type ATP synthase membrane subunit b/b'
MIRSILLLVGTAALGLASPESGGHGEAHGGDPYIWYKWFNFAILAGGLGYLVARLGVPALRGQQKSILKRLEEAQKKAAETERRTKQVEEKVAGLEREIAELRRRAAEEMALEARQMEEETRRLLEKVDQQAQLEIASAVDHARKELRAMAADLAVQLATERLAAEVERGAQERIVERFIRSLGDGRGGRN